MGRSPRFLQRDRDGAYGWAFRRKLRAMGIDELVSTPGSPWQNPYVERLIGSIRRECTDHIIPMGEAHLLRTVRENVEYYNTARPHQSLDGNATIGRAVESVGDVVATSVLGGLHHRYTRAAWPDGASGPWRRCNLSANGRRPRRFRLALARVLVNQTTFSAGTRALKYLGNQWATLRAFLDEPRIPVHSNDAERDLRHIVTGRKKRLVFGSERGGQVAARLYSLVLSCRQSGVDPETCVTDVLGRIATTPHSKLATLTPWGRTAARAAEAAD